MQEGLEIIFLQIKGTGSFLPEYILTNKELEGLVETSDEWITERTGIKQRRLAKELSSFEMAAAASRAAIQSAGILPDDIDIIIAATITPDYFTPSLSCLVQKQLGAKKAFCFDINAACSGFCYALDLADSYIKAGKAKTILIAASEALSRITDYSDRNTCVLFGDGAGAVVACAAGVPGLIDSVCSSVGSMGDVLEVSVFGDNRFIKMNGKEVYKFAVGANIETITRLAERNGLSIHDIDHIVLHQANKRIISAVCSKLGLDVGKMFINLEKYGNTSSASIPICLDEMNKKGMLKQGDKIVMVGFGGGLTYGGALMQWT